MDKNKLNKIGIAIFVAFILFFICFSGYMFFNNSSNLAISIRSNDEQIKRDEAVKEALTKLVVYKNDSLRVLGKKIEAIESAQRKDSVAITKKDLEIKKLQHEKDSLANLIRSYKWSDLEPVGTKPK